MPRIIKPTLFVFLICITVLMRDASGQEWPQYRGPDATGQLSSVELSLGSGKLKTHWRVPSSLGFSSFSIAGGKALTLIARDGQEFCIALDAETGKEIWATALGASEYGHKGGNAGAQGNKGGDGPRSTPSIAGDRVYVYDAHQHLFCLSLETGDKLWDHNVLKEYGGKAIKWKSAMSPLLDDSLLYVAGGGADHAFMAFEQDSGKLVWHSGTEGLTHASPSFAEINGQKQIVFFMQSGLVAVDRKTGREIWRSDFPFDVSTAASPIINDQRIYASAGYGVGAGLYEIDDSNKPNEIWRKPNRLINHWSSPVLRDGYLFGMYDFKRYGKAPLQCVEFATGEIKWKQAGYGQGNCIIIGDKVIALSDSGELAIVSATAEKYDELWREKLLDGKCWSTPAFSNGRIYLRSTKEAVCVSFE